MHESNHKTPDGSFFVVSGPSGSGKTTICRQVAQRAGLYLSVSATSRPQSPQEQQDRDYHFLSEEQFLQRIKDGQFLEYAKVFDAYYGTPAQPVLSRLQRGQTVLLEIDVQGAQQIFDKFPHARGVLVLPPNDKELRQRLSRRGRDDTTTIQKRLAKAHSEIQNAHNSGRYDYTVINDDLEKAITQLCDIVLNKPNHACKPQANNNSTENNPDD